jgi:WD40 repeat protein
MITESEYSCMNMMRTYRLAIAIVALSLGIATESLASGDVANFMIDDHGNVLKLSKICLAKTFTIHDLVPMRTCRRFGLLVTDYESGKKVAAYDQTRESDSNFIDGVYALDQERLVIAFSGDVVVWNMKTGNSVIHRGMRPIKTGFGNETPGVRPDERFIIAGTKDYPWSIGILMHDIVTGTATSLYQEYKYIFSPRFSPDGSKYAFLGSSNEDSKNETNHLIIQSLNSDDRITYQLDQGSHRGNLSWAPSGKHLAGICGGVHEELHVWNSEGKLVLRSPVPRSLRVWPPLWLQGEKEIAVFYIEPLKPREKGWEKPILMRRFPIPK